MNKIDNNMNKENPQEENPKPSEGAENGSGTAESCYTKELPESIKKDVEEINNKLTEKGDKEKFGLIIQSLRKFRGNKMWNSLISVLSFLVILYLFSHFLGNVYFSNQLQNQSVLFKSAKSTSVSNLILETQGKISNLKPDSIDSIKKEIDPVIKALDELKKDLDNETTKSIQFLLLLERKKAIERYMQYATTTINTDELKNLLSSLRNSLEEKQTSLFQGFLWSAPAGLFLEIMIWAIFGVLINSLLGISTAILEDKYNSGLEPQNWTVILAAPILTLVVMWVFTASKFQIWDIKFDINNSPGEVLVPVAFILGLSTRRVYRFLKSLVDTVFNFPREETEPGSNNPTKDGVNPPTGNPPTGGGGNPTTTTVPTAPGSGEAPPATGA